jgi:hypothetical protein
MIISVDTEKLSEQDKTILRVVLGGFTAEPAKTPVEDKPAPRRRAAAKAAAEPEPEPVEDEVADDGEDEDLLGAAPTLDDAVERATALVTDGKSAQVKKALAAVGAKRVSELAEDDVAAFLEAL